MFKPLTMSKNHSTLAFLVLMTFGLSHMCLAQSELRDTGVSSVALFYGVNEQDVLQNETWAAEAYMVGKGLRVIEKPGKTVPASQYLPGSPEVSLESRILQSKFRPVSGQFTWLQTAEGWYVVLPSKERFDVLFERTNPPKQ